ncbi:MAG: diguanylate cyclase [Lysobacter sp.]
MATLLLLGVGIAMIWGIVELRRSNAWVAHSYQVISQLDAANSQLRATESAARAYRRSGTPAQHADYLVATPQVIELSEGLLTLTEDNPQQNQRALQWQRVLMDRLAELERLVEDSARDSAATDTIIQADIRFSRTHRAHALANTMIDFERELLSERLASSDRRSNLLIGFVLLGIAVPLVLLSILLNGLLRENRRAHRLESEARQAVHALETTLSERDLLSEQRRILGNYAGLLQSCQSFDEAFSMTTDTLQQLLPDAGGHCYVMRASQNLAETTARFGSGSIATTDLLDPAQCWGLRRGQPHRIGDAHGRLRCAHLDAATPLDDIWTICVPLIAQGTTLGMLHASGHGHGTGAENGSAVVESIGEQLSLALANLQLRETMRMQSLRDPLTGLFNRRYLEENLSREFQRCKRRGLPLSVLMLDVDHFKRFNDEHGHAAGDAMLECIGKVLASLTRNEDIACRYGGEEFTIVLPEADANGAMRRAEEIRVAIASTSVVHMRRTLGPSTASIGVATFPTDGDTPSDLVAKADAALYRAKAEGRDRAVSTGSPTAPASTA